MVLIGFAGLGFAGYEQARRRANRGVIVVTKTEWMMPPSGGFSAQSEALRPPNQDSRILRQEQCSRLIAKRPRGLTVFAPILMHYGVVFSNRDSVKGDDVEKLL